MAAVTGLLRATLEDLRRRRLLWPAAGLLALIAVIPVFVFGSGNRGEAASPAAKAASAAARGDSDVVLAGDAAAAAAAGGVSGKPHNPFSGPPDPAPAPHARGAAAPAPVSATASDSGEAGSEPAPPASTPPPTGGDEGQGSGSDGSAAEPDPPAYGAVLGIQRDGEGWRGLVAREGRWIRSSKDRMARVETVSRQRVRVFVASDVVLLGDGLDRERVAYDHPTRIVVLELGAAVRLRDDRERRPEGLPQHVYELKLSSVVKR